MSDNKLAKLGLGRSLSLGAVQSLVRLVLGFASIKVTAVCIGPSGLALVAQLNNLISLVSGVLANPAGTAVVRLGAEHHADVEARNAVLSAALRLALVAGSVCAVFMLSLSSWISENLLATTDHAGVVMLSALAVIAVVVNIILTSAFNSVGELATMAKLQVWSTLGGFLLFVPGAYLYGISGALTGSALGYVLALFLSSAMLARGTSLRWQDFRTRPSAGAIKQVLAFYPMLIVHAALLPLTMLILRNMMMGHAGLEATGFWQAGWRLSDTYLALLTTAVSMYYMPKLGSLIKTPELFAAEVRKTLLYVVLLTGAAALSIYILREWIVRIVLARSFLPVVDLLGWQLVGDVVKMAAWVLAMTLTARMGTAWFIAAEVIRSTVFVGLAAVWLPKFGVVAVNWAYPIAMLAQLLLSAFALRKTLFLKTNSR